MTVLVYVCELDSVIKVSKGLLLMMHGQLLSCGPHFRDL